MTPKSFLALAGLTAVTAILAAISSMSASRSNVTADRGEAMFPSLAAKAGEIAEINIVELDDKTVVKRDGKTFVDGSGYPIKPELVRALLTSLALLKIDERKTSDAARHADLDLAKPEAKTGSGTQIALKSSSGRTLFDLVSGKREFAVGGTRGGQYVRSTNSTQAYLVRGTISLPKSRAAWFDTKILTVPADKTFKITMEPANNKDGFEIARNGKTLALVEVPEGRASDDAKFANLIKVAAPLTFSDVRKAKGEAKGPKLTFDAQDGISVTLQAVAEKHQKKDNWVRVSVTAPKVAPSKAGKDDKSKAKGEAKKAETKKDAKAGPDWGAIAKKVAGVEFELNRKTAALLYWRIKDVTKDAPKPKAEPKPSAEPKKEDAKAETKAPAPAAAKSDDAGAAKPAAKAEEAPAKAETAPAKSETAPAKK